MDSHLLNLDINAKLPIIRADSAEDFQRQCLENGVKIHRLCGPGGDEEDSKLTIIDGNNGGLPLAGADVGADDELTSASDAHCRLGESRIHDRNFNQIQPLNSNGTPDTAHKTASNNNNNNNSNNNLSNGNSSNNNLNNHHNHNQQHELHLNLPQPSFRLTPDCVYKKRKTTAALALAEREFKESYFKYEEPSAETLLHTVEYDLDEQDIEWLKIFNESISDRTTFRLTESDFENIMDRLEKESHFESKRIGKDSDFGVDEDAVCGICKDGNCLDTNSILFCDMCNLAVHQECYGVPYIPEGPWLCRRCLQSPSANVKCILCPNLGGAFKQTSDNKWAHVICALWIPEVCFANTVFLEPIDSIEQIPAARWKLTCYICKQKRNGACIQCHKANCYVPFHVTCAQQADLYMKISTCRYTSPDGGTLIDVKKVAYCDQHQPKDAASKKGGMYSDEDSEEEDQDTHEYKKKKHNQRERLKKTRRILAEKRECAFNPISEPIINEEKLGEISNLLKINKKVQDADSLRSEITQKIAGYWREKRTIRKGVPLLRRLQVTYHNNAATKITPTSWKEEDREKFTKLRFNLEKGRLLVGEVRKREIWKKKLFRITQRIIEQKFLQLDQQSPASEE